MVPNKLRLEAQLMPIGSTLNGTTTMSSSVTWVSRLIGAKRSYAIPITTVQRERNDIGGGLYTDPKVVRFVINEYNADWHDGRWNAIVFGPPPAFDGTNSSLTTYGTQTAVATLNSDLEIVAQGESITLTCTSQGGRPEASGFEWVVDGHLVQDGLGQLIAINGTEDEFDYRSVQQDLTWTAPSHNDNTTPW